MRGASGQNRHPAKHLKWHDEKCGTKHCLHLTLLNNKVLIPYPKILFKRSEMFQCHCLARQDLSAITSGTVKCFIVLYSHAIYLRGELQAESEMKYLWKRRMDIGALVIHVLVCAVSWTVKDQIYFSRLRLNVFTTHIRRGKRINLITVNKVVLTALIVLNIQGPSFWGSTGLFSKRRNVRKLTRRERIVLTQAGYSEKQIWTYNDWEFFFGGKDWGVRLAAVHWHSKCDREAATHASVKNDTWPKSANMQTFPTARTHDLCRVGRNERPRTHG